MKRKKWSLFYEKAKIKKILTSFSEIFFSYYVMKKL